MLCDVVILSNATDKVLKNLTRQAVKTLYDSEMTGVFNIIVCEQTTWKYNFATTLHMPGEFNYNRFANKAISAFNSPWVCVANNDVIFHSGWFSALLRVNAPVMSPANPANILQRRHKVPVQGTAVQEHFSGWCFVMRRSVWQTIGGFDEEFPFYCADNAVVRQLVAAGITPMLVPDSRVSHVVGATRKKLPAKERRAITADQVALYDLKYRQPK